MNQASHCSHPETPMIFRASRIRDSFSDTTLLVMERALLQQRGRKGVHGRQHAGHALGDIRRLRVRGRGKPWFWMGRWNA